MPMCLHIAVTLRFANFIQCFWSCVKTQGCWSGIVDGLLLCYFWLFNRVRPYMPTSWSSWCSYYVKHKRLFHLFTFATRKNILLIWVKGIVPSKKSWHNLIMECIPMNTCMFHSSVDHFYKIWDPYLVHIGPTLSFSIFQGFPKKD